jgi:predicted Zn-dependent protease with MMP-like domain
MKSSRLEAIAVEIVAAVQRKLPPELRGIAEGLPVHCERTPSPEILAEGFPPDILGLFDGPAYGEEPAEIPLPPQIFLYLDNLWEYADRQVAAFREEVRLTYLHELGHYLGWDEDEVAVRGLE